MLIQNLYDNLSEFNNTIIVRPLITDSPIQKKADKILVEKVVRALMLLEGLAKSDLDFVFKGGTALLLLFNSSKRLSIDIDIIVSDKKAEFVI